MPRQRRFKSQLIGNSFRMADKTTGAVFIKTGDNEYIDANDPNEKRLTWDLPGQMIVDGQFPLDLPGLDELHQAWMEGHEEWVARVIVERADTWQAVLCGVKIAIECGEGAGRMLADLVEEYEES